MSGGRHVCVGVNGIGVGHATRQLALAETLQARGHRATIVCSGRATRMFTDRGFAVHPAWLPALVGDQRRLLLGASLRANLRVAPGGLRQLGRLIAAMRSDRPDVFVTDFEPNVSLLAYLLRRPLISVDQQSKYRYLPMDDIDGFGRGVERGRLRLVAPRVDQGFICSFVPLPQPANRRVRIIAPLLSNTVRATTPTSTNLSVAYISAYFGFDPRPLAEELIASVQALPEPRQLALYLPPELAHELQPATDGRIAVRPFDRELFLADLARCDSVFSTAGFNLIAEALFLGKPVYVVPLPTYDQHWCGREIERRGIGLARPGCAAPDVRAFVDGLPDHRKAVEAMAEEGWSTGTTDPRDLIADAIENA